MGAMRQDGYDMTGPEPLTMNEIAEQISQAIGRTIRYVNVTLEERRRTLLAAGLRSRWPR